MSNNILFKGIKTVLRESFDKLNKTEKIGYIWFVRNDSNDERGDIYLGSRYYGTSRGDALTEEYVNKLIETQVADVKKQLNSLLNGDRLSFFCIDYVIVTINDVQTTYKPNSNVTVNIKNGDRFSITPLSDKSIYSLSSYPGALNTFHEWLNGVHVFENIIFDMNKREMYIHWSEYTQGENHVQQAQYNNCIFWSDLEYIDTFENRNNYCLTHTSNLPFCYSAIAENTFKPFYHAYNVTNDINWGNVNYKNSFANLAVRANAFSHYGLTNIGAFDDLEYNVITLPVDCRGLMYHSPNIITAGVFDASKCETFGATEGSIKEAFGLCTSLRNIYIKNLKTSINFSWSNIEQGSIKYIVNRSANNEQITIYLSPYSYYRLTEDIKSKADEKNIVFQLITTNLKDDIRLEVIKIDGDGDKFLSDDGIYKTKDIVNDTF